MVLFKPRASSITRVKGEQQRNSPSLEMLYDHFSLGAINVNSEHSREIYEVSITGSGKNQQDTISFTGNKQR